MRANKASIVELVSPPKNVVSTSRPLELLHQICFDLRKLLAQVECDIASLLLMTFEIHMGLFSYAKE